MIESATSKMRELQTKIDRAVLIKVEETQKVVLNKVEVRAKKIHQKGTDRLVDTDKKNSVSFKRRMSDQI